MALQIWLPLNGNLKNQGLMDFSTINNSNATISNNGILGQCYLFNGSSSRLYRNNINLPNNKCSVTLWFNPASITDTTAYLFSLNNGTSGSVHQIAVYITTSGLTLHDNGTNVIIPNVIQTNNWYHVAAVLNGAKKYLYLNGELISESTLTTATTTFLTLGARSNSSSGAGSAANYFFKGLMNDFRMYDEVLTKKQIKEIAKGLALHYPMYHEDSDTIVYDNASFGHHGTKTSTFNYGANCVAFRTGQAINKIPNPINAATPNFTLCAWGKPSSISGNGTFYTARTAIGAGIAWFQVGNKMRFDDNTQTTFSNYIVDTNWHHYVITRDTSSKKLYVDGVLKQTVSTVGNLGSIYTLGTIGGSDSGNTGIAGDNWFNGEMKDFRIYMTTLSADDIAALYNTFGSIDKDGNLYTNHIEEMNLEDTNLLETYDFPSYITNLGGASFSITTVDEPTSASGKAKRLECINAGTGYYINGMPWSTARAQFVNGQKYVVSMYIKAENRTSSRINVECSSSQSHANWSNLTTEYKKIYNIFTYNNSTTYHALTNYDGFNVGDVIYIHTFEVRPYRTDAPKLITTDRTIMANNFIEKDFNKIKIFKDNSVQINELNEI